MLYLQSAFRSHCLYSQLNKGILCSAFKLHVSREMSANLITRLDSGTVSERPRSKQDLVVNPGHGRQMADLILQEEPNPAAGLKDSDRWGCRKFVPVLGRDGTKIAPPGDIFNQPLG